MKRLKQSFNRYWFLLILFLLVLLLVGYLVIKNTIDRDKANAINLVKQEAQLLENLSYRLLQSGEYDALQPIISEWGINHPDTKSIFLVTKNGFRIAEFESKNNYVHGHTETIQIVYGYRGHATLIITKNIDWIYKNFNDMLFYGVILWLFIVACSIYILYNLKRQKLENKRLEQLSSDLAQTNKKLNEERCLLKSLIDSIPDLIFFKDRNSFYLGCNKAFEKYAGLPEKEQVGKTDYEFFDAETATFFRTNDQIMMQSGESKRSEEWVTYPDGCKVLLDTLKTPYYDVNGNILGLIGISRDITDIKRFQEQLEVMAYHDPLTNLPNRRYLLEQIQNAIAKANRNNTILALCSLDLDGFKDINDRFGHNTGDKALIEFGQRLTSSLRLADTVARWGGDEFTILFTDIHTEKECVECIERLLHLVNIPYKIKNESIKLSASIGITTFPEDTNDPDTLIRHADQAMYEAKLGGKNQYRFFDHQQNQLLHDHIKNRLRIEQAINDNEMILYYQPQIHLKQGSAYGVEALVRWNHPDEGILAPAQFLPYIEGHQSNINLDWWVIKNALEQMETWLEQELYLHISINITSSTIQEPDFIDKLSQLFKSHNRVVPQMVSFELLETAALGNLDQVAKKMKQCQALGMQFSLDDFGTGYSSLTYLSKLPADVLKIDQSFIRDMLVDEGDASIVEGIIKLASAFERRVIAEGVEEIMHGIRLLEMGCSLAQGYAIAKPMPADNLKNWLLHFKAPSEWVGTTEQRPSLTVLDGREWNRPGKSTP
jgi:diguanylate cyclase (GGDEF)-like protein/PAS domain S-box-containing protein